MQLLARVVMASALIATSLSLTAQETSDALAPIDFPREVATDAGTVVIHTPQIDTWKEFESIEARLAVEVTPTDEDEPVYGVAEFTADTDPNLELRVVAVDNLEITVTSFPVSDDSRREQLDAIVRGAIQKRTHFVPLDVILSYIAPDASVADEEGLSFEAPPIFYSSTPAILIMTDGEPVLAPVPDTKLKYAVNTNWDLFRYKDREWYLRVDKRWLKSKELGGPWRWDSRLPGDFKKLPDDGNWDTVNKAMPPAKGDADVPTVFVSDRPAELIVTTGQANLRSVGGPGLAYVPNTESDVFRYEQKYYYLVSGRWFIADNLRGPWAHVKELPAAFSAIDPESEKGHVLAAVPGTDEARLAVLEATLPRKATVSRDAGEKVNVFFQGEPVFEQIPGTTIERAVNSYNDILKVDNTYYLCDNAVWYVAKSTDGPWVVANAVPAVIYTIPPSSPSYHVTHVHVYDGNDSEVTTGYTSGYFGVSVSFGVAMYGTGWYYPSYYGYYPYYGYPYYPAYYPYPYSYGSGAWYNPNTGMYGRSAVAYGPYGGFGRAASYNPETGAYARGAVAWDSNEIAGRGVAYNPRTGTGIATHRYANESGSWGESLVTHNDKWLRTRSARGEQGTVIAGQTGAGRQGAVGRSAGGDLYAGKDGAVYRRDEDGWQQNTGDGWSRVDVSDERAAQIDKARASIADRQPRTEVQSRLGTRSFADSFGAADAQNRWSSRTYDSTRSPRSFDSNRRNELNRSFNARNNGYQRSNNRSAGNFNRGALGERQLPRRRR